MKEAVDMLNSVFLACRLIWWRIDQIEKEKKDNQYFKDEILKYKEKIGVLFKNMCQKVYQDVEYWYLLVAEGKDELEIFYLIMQSNSKFFIAEFSEELCGVAEKAQNKANEVQTKAQVKLIQCYFINLWFCHADFEIYIYIYYVNLDLCIYM